MYFYQLYSNLDTWQYCVSSANIIHHGDYYRLLTSPFLHGDIGHIYFNMTSLLIKSIQLEPEIGSQPFLVISLAMAVVGSVLYVILG